MTANRSTGILGLALVCLSLAAVGCSQSGGSPPATGAPATDTSAQATDTSAEASPTSAPSVIAAPTLMSAEVSSVPSPELSPAETPSAEPGMAEPPAASIAVEGGDAVVGQLGTFTWDNGGSSAPWLNGSPIHVGTGERLALALAEPVEIAEWSVSRVIPGNRDGTGAVAMQEGSGWPVQFDAPPSGQWSVGVKVRFADDRGDALYYWMIEVD